MNVLKQSQWIIESLMTPRGVRFLTGVLVLMVGMILLFALLIASAGNVHASSRIKDIVTVEGIRDNMLVGYGLVVGLNGTGDKLNNSPFTKESLRAFLERLGINTAEYDLKVKNVAAVTITATLPPFARSGGRIDVAVSTMGDAKSLEGGTLLATPLMGADGKVYSIAQGSVMVGGFVAQGSSATVSKGVPTNGFVPNGGIVEREIPFDLNSLASLKLALRNPDVETARRVAEAINGEMNGEIATVTDPGTVLLQVPAEFQDKVAMLLADVGTLEVQPDQRARVLIDEASGTIVMNENVRVSRVAVAQGNLVVRITEQPVVSQPGAFAPEGAETVEVERTEIVISDDGDKQLAVLDGGASLRELVAGLNALGVGPRDLITILQNIEAAGALQAEIMVR